MKTVLGIFLSVLVVGVTHGSLTHVIHFKSHLMRLQSEGGSLERCLSKVTHPLGEASQFARDVKRIEDLIDKLEGRISGTIDIINAVMLIPYVGAYAAPVLEPVSTVLNTIDSGLKPVKGEIDTVVGTIRGWLSPLEVVQNATYDLNAKITQVLNIAAKAQDETEKAEHCVLSLPGGSPKRAAESALDHVCSTLDHIPNALLSPLTHVRSGCSKVEHFLARLHLVRRKRGLPSLGKVISVLQHIDDAFGPLGHFLDKVNHALHKKICLLGEIIKIGKEIVHGVVHVGKEVVKGVEHVGEEVGKGVEHVAHEVEKGVEHVAHEVEKGVAHVGEEVAHGAEHVAEEVSHGVQHLGHEISHVFHHIFGRRSIDEVEHIIGRSAIDGRYYIIVDRDVDTRKRGLDLCFSIHDALKVVNGVTGGMLGEAQKFIGKLFHMKSIFQIPGLTADFLNLGHLLKPFHFEFPDVLSLLNKAESALIDALHLNTVDQYIKAIPVCEAVFTGDKTTPSP